MRSLCFLPTEYIPYTTELMRYLVESEQHSDSLRVLSIFAKEFLSSPARVELWNLHEVEPPFMNGYDEDWLTQYRDCWLAKSQQPSRSFTDLVAGCIKHEQKRVEYLLYRIQRWDSERRSKLNISKKPKLVRELVSSQVQNLLQNIQISGFSVKTFADREEEREHERRRRQEIGEKCLVFTRKMSKALEKIAEY